MWNDEKFRRLTPIPPCGQGLFFYLLTNPDTTNVPGLFRCGEAAMAEALNWDLKAFQEAFREAFLEGLVKADWKARVIWVPNAIKYNSPESPNVIKSWRGTLDEIPECELKNIAFDSIKRFVQGLGEGFQKAFQEAFPEGLPKEYGESGAGTGTGYKRVQDTLLVPTVSDPPEKTNPEAFALAQELKACLLANNPKARIPTNLAPWAIEVERMMRIEKRTPQEISAVLLWSQKDAFWKCNILSMAKLREKFDQLSLKMRAAGNGYQKLEVVAGGNHAMGRSGTAEYPAEF